MSAERRKFPRLSFDTKVDYRILNKSEIELFTTGCRNIGTMGICIIIFERLNPQDVLELKFSLPGLNRFIIVKGKVVWVSKLKILNKHIDTAYEAGIEFVDLQKKDRDEIEKFIISKN